MAKRFDDAMELARALVGGYNTDGLRWTLRRWGSGEFTYYELRARSSDHTRKLELTAALGEVLAGRWIPGRWAGDFKGAVSTDQVVVRLGCDVLALRQAIAHERDAAGRATRTRAVQQQAIAMLNTLAGGGTDLDPTLAVELLVVLRRVAPEAPRT